MLAYADILHLNSVTNTEKDKQVFNRIQIFPPLSLSLDCML